MVPVRTAGGLGIAESTINERRQVRDEVGSADP
jgi:hypothetical protein